MRKYMQRNLVNPYIVALNTAGPHDSKALEDGFIFNVLKKCVDYDAMEALRLRMAIDECRDNEHLQSPAHMRRLAYELAHLRAKLPCWRKQGRCRLRFTTVRGQ